MALRDSKEGMAAYKLEWRRTHPESTRATQRKQTIRHRGDPYWLAYYARYRAKHRVKIRARKQLNNAIKRGDILRLPCEICERSDAEGHHDDYTKPFDVKWLCKLHHEQHHHEI